MSITSIAIGLDKTGETGVCPAVIRVACTDNYASVVSAGFLNANNMRGNLINNGDLIIVSYNSNANTAIFVASVANNVITLTHAGNAVLPTVAGNVAAFSNTTGNMQDSGLAANTVLYSGISTPDQSPNLVYFSASIARTSLATGGSATLIAGSGVKSYRVIDLFLSVGTGYTGGDRGIIIQDSSSAISFSTISAATVQTPVNARWGSTAVSYPAAALNLPSTPGSSIVAKYSGGTTDYTGGGPIVLTGILLRVA